MRRIIFKARFLVSPGYEFIRIKQGEQMDSAILRQNTPQTLQFFLRLITKACDLTLKGFNRKAINFISVVRDTDIRVFKFQPRKLRRSWFARDHWNNLDISNRV